MRLSGRKEFTAWEWVTIFGVVATAIVVTEILDFNQGWKDSVVYTVALFAIVIASVRPAWSRKGFWWNVLLLFVLHDIGLVALISVVPLGRFGIPKIIWTMALVLEALLIAAILWKRSAASERRRIK